jgi:hypothetical protein
MHLQWLDPKYLLPDTSTINADEWRQRRFALGMLLLEQSLGRQVLRLDDVVFEAENHIQFPDLDQPMAQALNLLLLDLVDPTRDAVADLETFRHRLQRLLLPADGFQPIQSLWISTLVTSQQYRDFLAVYPQAAKQPGQSWQDGMYLSNFASLAPAEAVRRVNGHAAKAYCDVYSQHYACAPRYHQGEAGERAIDAAPRRPGFRLLTPTEHQALRAHLPDYDPALNELLADDTTWLCSRGNYRTISDHLSSHVSVFRLCFDEEVA